MTQGLAQPLRSGLPVQPSLSLRPEAASTLDVLARIADQVGRDTELYRLLGEIAHATRNLLDIDRVSIFILDGDKLLPAVSASRAADDELWATFRTLPPVAVDLSTGRSLLTSPHAVLIDARVSPVVPQDWRDAFGLTSLALAPLHVGGVPRGVIIGDSGDPTRARLSRDQLQALETVASLAGLAVGRYDAAAAAASITAKSSGLLAVASIVTEGASLAALVERLADPVRVAARAELLEVVVHGRARAQALNLRAATGSDAAQVARWRRKPEAAAMALVDGRALVPLRASGEVIGALIVRAFEDTDGEALQHISLLVAGMLESRVLRAELAIQRNAYDAVVARSRLEAAARRSTLEHLDRAASSLGTPEAQAQRNGVRPSVDAARVAESLGNARTELTSTQDVLLNLANVRGGLAARLRALSRAMTRPAMRVEVKASPGVGAGEPPGTTQLVVGVREVIGLASAARASRVLVRLRQEPHALVTEVRSDGRLALASGPVGPSSYHVVRTLQRDLEAFGAQVSLDNDGSWFTVRFLLPTLAGGNGKASSTVLSR